jgi:hypothetical protein
VVTVGIKPHQFVKLVTVDEVSFSYKPLRSCMAKCIIDWKRHTACTSTPLAHYMLTTDILHTSIHPYITCSLQTYYIHTYIYTCIGTCKVKIEFEQRTRGRERSQKSSLIKNSKKICTLISLVQTKHLVNNATINGVKCRTVG